MTATALLDVSRLDANIRRFHAKAAAAGVGVRAHVKAHRMVEVTRRQAAAGAAGIAVTYVREARRHLAAGLRDVVMTWPWLEEWRWPLLAELGRDCDLSVHVDRADGVAALAAAAREAGTVIGVRIEVGERTGDRSMTRDEVLALAGAVEERPELRLDGVTGYRALMTPAEVRKRHDIGRGLARLLVDRAEHLRAHRISCPVVAVGGTPTADGALEVDGVTEICGGAYPLLDAGMAAAGMCGFDDVALSVGATLLGGGRTDADELLRGAAQPWASPEEVATLADGTPIPATAEPGTVVTLLPAHICPLIVRLPGVDTAEGRWNVHHLPDEGPP
ncbi:alanine racemase [Sphaerimonospora thailandensis]|uniref:Alanine racemase N-terminal domain-containing protein n=1 Tax=Sphaerimonospora thailandensis TaxID=795644 RepID=A0A8J3R9M1_9ACTN|nr:alanine racemase [Sphaerimonospora thailandensis]GIH71936.1 hypothetical protein Mth01_41890 [Sphaerimonospora thailandensis]